MVSRLAPIFIAVSVVMHCLPVQRCVVERLAFGASCHGESACETASAPESSDDLAFEAAAAHSHGECICQAPNAPADRGNGQAAIDVHAADLPMIDAILSTAAEGNVVYWPPATPTGSPPLGFVLPLLL